MKQTEILDLILKGLYEEGRDDFRSLGMIINKYSIPVETFEEFRRLAKRLESDGLIGNLIFTRSDISAKLTSYGIDYCEGDSYTYSGCAIITNNYNINVENSSDTTIVSQSDNVKLNIAQSEIKDELLKIIETIKIDGDIPENSKQSMTERINFLINKL